MNFKLKCFAHKVFQTIPMGGKLYFLAQKFITKSLRKTDDKFLQRYNEKVLKHLAEIQKFGTQKINDAVFYEFGAGWDLNSPLGFSLIGYKGYYAVDIVKLLKNDILKNQADQYRRNISVIEEEFGIKTSPEVLSSFDKYLSDSSDMESFMNDINLHYLAPYDARNTDLEDESIDYIISNVTLEHIPEESIKKILGECCRIIKKDGIFCATIDYSDHWSHSDSSINAYNYMRYSEKEWKKYNPSSHYQNRLQHPDYIRLFNEAGFEILKVKTNEFSDKNMEALNSIPLAEEFLKYSKEDLVIKSAQFVLKKQ